MTVTQEKQAIIDRAAETLGKDLLEARVDELKVLQDPWSKTSQYAQDNAIARLHARISVLIYRAVAIVAAGDFPVIEGHVESVTFKDGVKAVITTTKGESAHELADAEGGQCLVLVVEPDQYIGRMAEIKGDADQRLLEFPGINEPA